MNMNRSLDTIKLRNIAGEQSVFLPQGSEILEIQGGWHDQITLLYLTTEFPKIEYQFFVAIRHDSIPEGFRFLGTLKGEARSNSNDCYLFTTA